MPGLSYDLLVAQDQFWGAVAGGGGGGLNHKIERIFLFGKRRAGGLIHRIKKLDDKQKPLGIENKMR